MNGIPDLSRPAKIFRLYESREERVSIWSLKAGNVAAVLMQQMVPEVPAAMIVKARSLMLERSMGSRSDASAEPVFNDYRACLDGLKAIEVYRKRRSQRS